MNIQTLNENTRRTVMKKIHSILTVIFNKRIDKKTELDVSGVQRKRVIIVVKKPSEDLEQYFNGVLDTRLSESN